MSHVYSSDFQAYTDESSRHTALRVSAFLQPHLSPVSVLDVGCARGAWLQAWQQAGVTEIQGIDGDYVDRSRLAIPQGAFLSADLSRGFDLGRTFDLVQSLEVAEHLAPERAAQFVETLTRHSRGLVLFSAAPPGQGGEHHVNERPYGYWRELFRQQDYAVFDPVRPHLAADERVSFWYRYNVLLYVREDRARSLPAAIASTRIADDAPIPDVSPPAFRLRKQLVRLLPYAVQQALARAKARLHS